jgi:hypothetical protein
VGHFLGRSQRGFSSDGKLVEVAVNENTGKKLFHLTDWDMIPWGC